MDLIVVYLKCVVAGLLTLVLVFGVYFLTSVVAVEMIGFTIGPSTSRVFWPISLAVFGAGFLREFRRLAK